MTHKRKLFELPCLSASVFRGPTLYTDGGDLLLSMDFYDQGQKRSACLRFVKERAIRTRSEVHCTEWHVTDTFDTMCEVIESDWVRELRADSVPEWRDYWVMRHFIIYVDSFGCVEVAAESVALVDEALTNSAGT